MIWKFCIVLIGICTTSCASIIHGSKQDVDFSSSPPGAKVTIDEVEYGNTPTTVKLMRIGRLKGEKSTKNEYKVKIELAGFYPYEIKIKREMDGWFLGNIVAGGIIGIIVDASNGSMYKLTPDQIVANMNRETASVKRFDKNIFIKVSLETDPNWEKIAQLTKAK